ncbi:hypothetical protein SLS58_009303 [Diplodia intermedia]|uniref:Transcriptional regulator n=1 Tax=Diplodia intermedia TaxID=856260 RepID=A0ABR3TD87_9PEZI
MSDSDAEPVPAIAPDAKIEHALRNVVRDLWLSGDHENLTLRRVRKSVEHQLDLPDSFFRTDRAWKDRSENVITDQVSAQEREGGEAAPVEPEVPRAKAPKTARKRKPSTNKAAPVTKPTARKRRKASSSSDDEALRSDATKSPQPDAKRLYRKSRVVQDDAEDEGGITPAPRPSSSGEGNSKLTSAHVGNGDSKGREESMSPARDAKPSDSDSDMSVLIDEPPKKKQQKRGTSAKASKPANSKSKPKGDKDADPQEAEIKRLQGWLIKCGIRKLWGKELKPFETPKAKVNHLKAMLADAGMEGRYSAEKARQIKERRELAADLEAVQEGAKRWGQSESDEDNGARPNRRLAKGLKDLEGLVESGDEESE